MRKGKTYSALSLEKLDGQYNMLLGVKKAEDSLFYEPFEKMLNDTDFGQKIIKPIQDEAKVVIMKEVLPAYRKIKSYIDKEYKQATRSQIGLLSSKDGLDFYEKTLKAQVSVDSKSSYQFISAPSFLVLFHHAGVTPKMIHDMGIKEVALLRKEVKQVTDEIGFNGTYRELVDYITSQPGQVFQTKDEVMGT